MGVPAGRCSLQPAGMCCSYLQAPLHLLQAHPTPPHPTPTHGAPPTPPHPTPPHPTHLLEDSSPSVAASLMGVSGDTGGRPCSEPSVQMAGTSPSRPRGSPAAAGSTPGQLALVRHPACMPSWLFDASRSRRSSSASLVARQHTAHAQQHSTAQHGQPTCVVHPGLLSQRCNREHEGDAVAICQRHAAALAHALAIHVRAIAAQVLFGCVGVAAAVSLAHHTTRQSCSGPLLS